MEAMALSVAFATKGTVREARGFDFDQVNHVVLDRELDIHQATTFKARARASVWRLISAITSFDSE